MISHAFHTYGPLFVKAIVPVKVFGPRFEHEAGAAIAAVVGTTPGLDVVLARRIAVYIDIGAGG